MRRQKMSFDGFKDNLKDEFEKWAIKQAEYPRKEVLTTLTISELLGVYPDCESWADFFSKVWYENGDLQGLAEMETIISSSGSDDEALTQFLESHLAQRTGND